jgi:inosine/xanthosine triphosphatase
MEGAVNRAKAALALAAQDGSPADYGVGIEGGLEKIGDRWFECGWVAVVQAKDGKVGYGSCGRYEVSGSIVRRLQAGEELCVVMDDLSGQSDVRSAQGMMGIVTNGLLDRRACYEHGVFFGFAPFISDARYWAP